MFTVLLISGIAGVLIFLFLFLFVIAAIAYLRFSDKRYDGNIHLKYFTEKDFPGIRAEPVSFLSDQGQILRGFLYSAVDSPKGLVVFVHGFGAGHHAYMTEIAFFVGCGFLVLAYDGSGCVLSDGVMRGFEQGPFDLAAALRFASTDVRLCDFERIVLVGHSWGAFTVMNSLETDARIAGGVAMCGFVSAAEAMGQTGCPKFRPLSLLLSVFFRWSNRLRFGKEGNKNSISSLCNTEKKVLLLYGKKDGTVSYKYNGARVAQAVRNRKNIKFISYENKGHNVYLSERAESYMNGEFVRRLSLAKKQKIKAADLLADVDYSLLTEEDPAVMEEIGRFCFSCFEDEKSV